MLSSKKVLAFPILHGMIWNSDVSGGHRNSQIRITYYVYVLRIRIRITYTFTYVLRIRLHTYYVNVQYTYTIQVLSMLWRREVRVTQRCPGQHSALFTRKKEAICELLYPCMYSKSICTVTVDFKNSCMKFLELQYII